MLFEASNFDRQSIINNAVAPDKATPIFDGPIVLSMAESKGISGYRWPAAQGGHAGSGPPRAFHAERVGRGSTRCDKSMNLGEQTTHQEKRESYERTQSVQDWQWVAGC